ncbi:MAG: ribulose-phosphate 3-epimerase [Verrucomicrobiota bacterium]
MPEKHRPTPLEDKQPLTGLDAGDILVAPSILAADFAALGRDIGEIDSANADIVHVDVMDGHFVPNLTIGPPVVKSIRKCTSLPFDVHLMLDNPENFIAPFAEAGADNLTIHTEIDGNIGPILDDIHQRGCSAGLCLRPNTPADSVAPYLDRVDLILVMTVEPGFGGQSFQAEMLPKIRELRTMIRQSNRPIHLEVDGGIDNETAPQVTRAGANLLVAGTSVFRSPQGVKTAIQTLRTITAD